MAKETGFLKRKRALDPFAFLHMMTFGLFGQNHPSLQSMIGWLKTDMTPTALHYRFTEKTVEFMSQCLMYFIKKILQYQCKTLPNTLLKPFKHILLFDSSRWDLPEALKDFFPGCGGSASKANCKLQLVYDYITGMVKVMEIVPGKEPDQGYSKNIPRFVEQNDLVIFDLGYFVLKTFKKIQEKGAYFISRFLLGTGVSVIAGGTLCQIDLLEYLPTCDNSFEMNVVLGGSRNVQVNARLIGFKCPEEYANKRRMILKKNAKKNRRQVSKERLKLCDWNLFVTNASDDLLPAKMIRTLYRIRWTIELVFKQLKSVLKIHKTTTSKNHRFLCEVYGKLIVAVIVHCLYSNANALSWTKHKKEMSFDKLWKFFVDRAIIIYSEFKKGRTRGIKLMKALLRESIKQCQKKTQLSRLTTWERIINMVGDDVPVLIVWELEYEKEAA